MAAGTRDPSGSEMENQGNKNPTAEVEISVGGSQSKRGDNRGSESNPGRNLDHWKTIFLPEPITRDDV